MVSLTLRGTSNITGNGYVTSFANGMIAGGSTTTNLAPALFGGLINYGGTTIWVQDGVTGPRIFYANQVGVTDQFLLPYPVRCTNGIHVNMTAAANTIILYA